MHVILLGTAAGGGVPQWNCWCPVCRVARETPARARPRTQSSIAVSADGAHWFLCNASPDVRQQLAALDAAPAADARRSPVEGVLLTDAELDHSLGIVLLREARALTLYATGAVQSILERDSRLLPVTRAFAEVAVRTLPLDEPLPLALRDGSASGLVATAFAVAGDPPRFAGLDAAAGHTVGLALRDEASGATLCYVPGCGALDDALLARLGAADAVLFDGTFWADDEMRALGLAERTAAQMGHVPIAGPQGSLQALAALPSRRRVYTHINNTNPVLLEDSAERRAVVAAGIEVGHDGMRFTL